MQQLSLERSLLKARCKHLLSEGVRSVCNTIFAVASSASPSKSCTPRPRGQSRGEMPQNGSGPPGAAPGPALPRLANFSLAVRA